jgi:hypothetical protein
MAGIDAAVDIELMRLTRMEGRTGRGEVTDDFAA